LVLRQCFATRTCVPCATLGAALAVPVVRVLGLVASIGVPVHFFREKSTCWESQTVSRELLAGKSQHVRGIVEAFCMPPISAATVRGTVEDLAIA
jgi:hypothetical protein